MKWSVKNMVCPRCIIVVHNELEMLSLNPGYVKLGEFELIEDLDSHQLTILKSQLLKHGLEVIDDRKAMLVEKVKNIIIEIVHNDEKINIKKNFSSIIGDKLKVEYNYVSSLFSITQGLTIEKYIILQKIERAKELLVYNELSLSEIADKLGYVNVQHLSTQFKKITGLTPSYFKVIKKNKRTAIDLI
ncbi:MAG TPA: AraC family transcriptional regulator [Flavobacteriaceae bacterium]|nr:AraC family transcriptional regulator [Flavobacteriaceae bacterium]HAT66645.1 AraC family transcriptional regulator [Flavobacteriaceae bacterium]